MLVAEGAAEVMLEIGPTLWDLAAPSLIVAEAGGRLTDFAGPAIVCRSAGAGHQRAPARGDGVRPGRGMRVVGRGRWTEVLMALVPIALAVFTLVVLVEPGVPPAIVNLRLALAIDAVATLVGRRRSPSWAGSGTARAVTRRPCGAHRPCWCWGPSTR